MSLSTSKHKDLSLPLAFLFLQLSSSFPRSAALLLLCTRAGYCAIRASESASFPTRFSTWDFSGKHCQLACYAFFFFFWKTPCIWKIKKKTNKKHHWAICRWRPRTHYLPKERLTKKVMNCSGGGEISLSLLPGISEPCLLNRNSLEQEF